MPYAIDKHWKSFIISIIIIIIIIIILIIIILTFILTGSHDDRNIGG